MYVFFIQYVRLFPKTRTYFSNDKGKVKRQPASHVDRRIRILYKKTDNNMAMFL